MDLIVHVGSIPTPGTMRIRSLFADLRRRVSRSTPLIEVRLSRSALLHNLKEYQDAFPGVRIAPVLKSNAYGHGSNVIARLLDKEDIAFFMVDSLYEARYLRWSGIRSRIVVMGYVRPADIARSRLQNVDYALVSLEQVKEVASLATRPLRVHLKLDTGMHRQGVMRHELEEALETLNHPLLKVVGVCSHLCDADNENEEVSMRQLHAWQDMSTSVVNAFPAIEYRHLVATKGVRFLQKTNTNVARIGIGLYGITTAPGNTLSLLPVLSMYSPIASIRQVPKGDTVGYNATYTAPSLRQIATIPAGYYEGVDRALSNSGSMLVRGVACPIAGRVSMNMTSIDVSDVKDAMVGDEVTVISGKAEDPNSISSMAKTGGTTAYVLLAHIPQHLRRVVGK